MWWRLFASQKSAAKCWSANIFEVQTSIMMKLGKSRGLAEASKTKVGRGWRNGWCNEREKVDMESINGMDRLDVTTYNLEAFFAACIHIPHISHKTHTPFAPFAPFTHQQHHQQHRQQQHSSILDIPMTNLDPLSDLLSLLYVLLMGVNPHTPVLAALDFLRFVHWIWWLAAMWGVTT